MQQSPPGVTEVGSSHTPCPALPRWGSSALTPCPALPNGRWKFPVHTLPGVTEGEGFIHTLPRRYRGGGSSWFTPVTEAGEVSHRPASPSSLASVRRPSITRHGPPPKWVADAARQHVAATTRRPSRHGSPGRPPATTQPVRAPLMQPRQTGVVVNFCHRPHACRGYLGGVVADNYPPGVDETARRRRSAFRRGAHGTRDEQVGRRLIRRTVRRSRRDRRA